MAPHAIDPDSSESSDIGIRTPGMFYGRDMQDSIAVVGYSMAFPQDATTSDNLWQIMLRKHVTATAFPEDRVNIDSMYHPDTSRKGQVPLKRGHFLKDDLSKFDAAFFSTSSTDAAAMDPQQRLLLEHTYKALENAGLPMEQVSGSKTSVYTGVFFADWQTLSYKDSEKAATTTALGVQPCVNANRISWFFNFMGNSANIDTACSSSLVALDLGCKGLLNGDEDMSIVAGCNIILAPDTIHSLTNMNMLSPDGLCYSFDHRGNGYSRSDGVGVLVLKRVSDAIRDNDTIRGIIRNSGCNQDGNTPGVTQPSWTSQEALIRSCYGRAGLDMEPTRFFEAHGTGTAVGDPLEARALGSAFRRARSTNDPLWVGALKSNIGHLEGASGVAGVIKALMVLEKGVIPPNANFEKVNPKIDTDFLGIKFPSEAMPWPTTGLRRTSVNSFGFAGTNAHVVLDDVYHFLEERGLFANHNTVKEPPNNMSPMSALEEPAKTLKLSESDSPLVYPRLLMFSAQDEAGIKRQASEYVSYFSNLSLPEAGLPEYLNRLAYTLHTRRSSLPWKSFATVKSFEDLRRLDQIVSPAKQSITETGIGFVFTGQGAQWAGMGRELIMFAPFRQSLQDSETYLASLGCSWLLMEEIFREIDSRIDSPDIAQPACTAIQIALVDLLGAVNVRPTAVVGHSSGEIGAAYSIGAISAKSAMKIAYHRGSASFAMTKSGTMCSIGLSKEEVQPYLDQVTSDYERADLTVACINSTRNVTVSGDVQQVDALLELMASHQYFARKLAVKVAYHSPHMEEAAQSYRTKLTDLEPGISPSKPIPMFSSVSGTRVKEEDLCTAEYWVSNMLSPVQFLDSLSELLARSAAKVRKRLDLGHRNHFRINMLLEIGPHPALRAPVKDILTYASNSTKVSYASILARKISADDSALAAFGEIRSLGYPLDIEYANNPMTTKPMIARSNKQVVLHDLPSYAFDHSKKYWYETRWSNRFRTQNTGKLDLLGKPVIDWNPSEPRWRNFYRLGEMPWLEDHVINGSNIYPGSGMVVAAIEAANQLSMLEVDVEGFEVKDMHFMKPLVISQDSYGTETQLSIRLADPNSPKVLETWSEFRLFSIDGDKWTQCCRGMIRVKYSNSANPLDHSRESVAQFEASLKTVDAIRKSCNNSIDVQSMYKNLSKDGLHLGPAFQRVQEGSYNQQAQVYGRISPYEWAASDYPQPHVVHTISLDAMFHLALAGRSYGGRINMPTMIPTFLRRLYIPRSGVSSTQHREVHESCWINQETIRDTIFSAIALDAAESSIALEFDDLYLTTIAEAKPESTEEKLDADNLAYHVKHKADVDLMDSTSIKAYCASLQSSRYITPFDTYLDLLAHKNPDLHILELDAGDLDFTKSALRRLSVTGPQGDVIQTRYGKYHFFASSKDAVEGMQSHLSEYPRTSFELHDFPKDAVHNTEIIGTFDIVIAPPEIASASTTLQNLLPLLKSTCRLLLHDSHRGDIAGNIMSATAEAPLYLKESGFEPMNLNLQCTVDINNVESSIVTVHRLRSEETPQFGDRKVIAVVNQSSKQQAEFSSKLRQALTSHRSNEVNIMSLNEAAGVCEEAKAIFVLLLEYDESFLYSVSSQAFTALQKLLLSAHDVVWVSQSQKPEYQLIQGLARAIRAERRDLRMTTISLNGHSQPERQADRVVNLIQQNHLKKLPKWQEIEFCEIDGLLNIARISSDVGITQHVLQSSQPQHTTVTTIKDAPPLKLELGSPGMIDSLRYVEDVSGADPPADDEVEIQCKAIGVNFRDCLIALGQIPSTKMGQECSGIVTRAGTATGFRAGDKVLAFTAGTFRTFVRANAVSVHKVPDNIDFETAAAIPVQFMTAFAVTYSIARLQRGESILIHAAAGGTGQALVQMAKLIGANIYATVGSAEKKQLLIDQYKIPANNIFYSRDGSFAKGVMRATNGRGVDVVVNSLSGDELLASWECIAQFGRFIEIGLKDVLANSKLPMYAFRKNTSFIAFDGSAWQERRAQELRKDMEHIIKMFADNTLHVPRNLHAHDVSEVVRAFQELRDGSGFGKHIVKVELESNVTATIKTKPSFNLERDTTYVVAGGLGGLGRATARWLANRGAGNLILLSRFGPRTDAAQELLKEMSERGVRVETPACDISNAQIVQDVFGRLIPNMPPIKGCFNMSVLAEDTLFEKMTYEKWRDPVNAKTMGSWHLHTALPKGMDFFVLLASASGLAGLRGQTNYDAGNVYEDNLARYRVANGEKAISLDLGALLDDGILAETPELLARVKTYGVLDLISRQKFYGILDYCCNPALPLLTPDESQLAVGLGIGGGGDLDSFDTSHQPMLLPLALEGARRQELASADDSGAANEISPRAMFSSSPYLEKAAEIVVHAIIRKLGKSLLALNDVDLASVDLHKPLQSYGVDSLLAIELRNWVVKEFSADIAVFETQGASTLSSLSMVVAGRSTIKHEAWTL